MSTLHRILVGHAHPVNVVLHAIGIMWAVYFLWQGNFYWAAIFGLGLPVVGTIAVWGQGEKELEKTPLGKLMLIHEDPVNMGFHIAGWIVTVYGVWIHEPISILTGVSFVLMGHMWGWKKY